MWTLIVLGLVVARRVDHPASRRSRGGGNKVTVPDVRNQPIAQATAALKAKGLKVTTDTAISTDVSRRQRHRPGPAARRQGEEGQRRHADGERAAPARSTFPTSTTRRSPTRSRRSRPKASRCSARTKRATTVDKDLVIRTDPAGGTPATKGSTVQVFVSTGKEQKPIPDVTGLSEDDGFAQLGQAGFAVRTVTEPSSSVSNGKVTRTDPPAGTIAARGSTVRMFVSTRQPVGVGTERDRSDRGRSARRAERARA